MKFRNLWIVFLFLSACSFKNPDPSEVNVSFYFEGQGSNPSPMEFPGKNSYSPFAAITPPYHISGFDCFAVNVMGEGISPFIPGDFNADIPRLIGGDLCASYPGSNSIMVNSSFTGSVELQVPSGASRYIQVLGFPTTDMGCRSDKPWVSVITEEQDVPNFITRHFGGLFEVGSTVRDLFRDEQIQVVSTYNSNNPRDLLDCIDGPGPEEVTSMRLWYIADDFQDSYTAGQTISNAWRNAKRAIFGVPLLFPLATGPTFHPAAGPNGKPTVRFDGSNDEFKNTSLDFGTNSTGASVVAVVKASVSGAKTIFGISSGTAFSAASNDFILLTTDASDKFQFQANKVVSQTATATLTTASSLNYFYTVIGTYDPNGGVVTVEANNGLGSAFNSNASVTSIAYGSSTAVYIGSAASSVFWNGDIAEIIYYDKVISNDDKSKIKDYLGRKYSQPYN